MPTSNFYEAFPTTDSRSSLTSTSAAQVLIPTTQYYSATVTATFSSTAPTNTVPTRSSSSNIGIIVGGILGGLTLVFLIVIALIFLKRYQPSIPRQRGKKDIIGESTVLTGPVADTRGMHEIYDNRQEAVELDHATSVIM